jgi:hypothetical protein
VCDPRLLGELEVVLGEKAAIQAESELHVLLW